MSKKNKVIQLFLGATVSLIIGYLLFINYTHSTLGIYNSVSQTAISSGGATTVDFSDCKTDTIQKTCIGFAVGATRAGMDDKMASAGVFSEDADAEFRSAQELADQGNYQDAQTRLASAKSRADKAIVTRQVDINAAKNVALASVKNSRVGKYRILDSWAVVDTIPNSDGIDPAIVVLKKDNNKWSVFIGPGTSFVYEELTSLEIPIDIADYAANGIPGQDNIYN